MQRLSGLNLKAITINTFFQFAIRIITSTSTLIATLIIAYFSGYEMLGSFTKVVAFVSIFYLFVDFGMNSVFLKLHFDNAKENMGNLIVLRFLIAVIIIPLVILIAFLLPQNATTGSGYSMFEKSAIAIYSFTILSVALYNSYQAFLQKKLIYNLSFLPSLLSSITVIVFIFAAVRTGNYFLLFYGYVAGGLLLVITLSTILRQKFGLQIRLSQFKPFAKTLAITSIPLGLMLLFNLVYAKVDMLILSFYRPTVEVGIYGVSYRFFELAIAIPTFLANSTYPLLLKERESGNYSSIFSKYIKLFLILSIATTVIVFIGAPFISIFKNEFILSSAPLQILSLSLPFFFLTSLLQWNFLIKGKINFLVPLYAFALILNIILNLIFIPKYSYFAASITTGLSEGLVFFVMVWYFFKSKNKSSK